MERAIGCLGYLVIAAVILGLARVMNTMGSFGILLGILVTVASIAVVASLDGKGGPESCPPGLDEVVPPAPGAGKNAVPMSKRGARAMSPTAHRLDTGRLSEEDPLFGERRRLLAGLSAYAAKLEKEKQPDRAPPPSRIVGTEFRDLEQMNGITAIYGDLEIEGNSQLECLEGLSSLRRVEGSLRIVGNGSLRSLEALRSLERVGGDVVITYCGELKSYQGLEHLESVGGDLLLQSSTIEGLDGFVGLRHVGGDLDLEDMPNLRSLSGMAGLLSVGGWLMIRMTRYVHDVDELESLMHVGAIGDKHAGRRLF